MNIKQGEPLLGDMPCGIRGWLILAAIGVVISPIIALVYLSSLLKTFESSTWAALTTIGSKAYHPLWVPLIYFELIYNLALFISLVINMFLFFRKKRVVPKLMVIIFSSNIVFALIDSILINIIYLSLHIALSSNYLEQLIRAFIAGAIWIPYFIYSKRVKNTFVN